MSVIMNKCTFERNKFRGMGAREITFDEAFDRADHELLFNLIELFKNDLKCPNSLEYSPCDHNEPLIKSEMVISVVESEMDAKIVTLTVRNGELVIVTRNFTWVRKSYGFQRPYYGYQNITLTDCVERFVHLDDWRSILFADWKSAGFPINN